MSEFGDEVVKDWDAFLKTNRQPSGVGPVDAFWSRVWEGVVLPKITPCVCCLSMTKSLFLKA